MNVPAFEVEFHEQVAVVVPEVELALDELLLDELACPDELLLDELACPDELLLEAPEVDELPVAATPELDELLPCADDPPIPLLIEPAPLLPVFVAALPPLPPTFPPPVPVLLLPELQAPVPIPTSVYNTTMPDHTPLNLIESPKEGGICEDHPSP